MKHLMEQEGVTCWEWKRGGKLGQIFTFIFLAVVLFEDVKRTTSCFIVQLIKETRKAT